MFAIARPVAAIRRPPIARAVGLRNKSHRRREKSLHHRNSQLLKHDSVYVRASARLRRRELASAPCAFRKARTYAPQTESAPAETNPANDVPGNPLLCQI